MIKLPVFSVIFISYPSHSLIQLVDLQPHACFAYGHYDYVQCQCFKSRIRSSSIDLSHYCFIHTLEGKDSR